ncbi:protein FAF-like, chloroplastic [Aristolochia californica]|uniref:protein FAF-like, chloroplastic n=1 Tax=Aristolochia californica TaxID=171875 RepID=UPI0035DD6607
MSAVSKRIRSSAIEEERKITEKQGIGSILRTSDKLTRPSLRRTFSADMSSKKWLADQTLKKVPSTEEFSTYGNRTSDSSSGSSSEQEYEERRRKDLEQPAQFDIWSSILAQKEKDSNPLNLPPYLPPLAKRSSSSLSKKSLETCTENLGSETGSDGFSSNFDSYSSSEEEEEEQPQAVTGGKVLENEIPVTKYSFSAPTSRRCPPRSFPPPLSSISRPDGPRIHMRPHRKDGRLVLEAVPLPTQNCLHAERQDGRLLLTLIKPPEKRETRPAEDGEKQDEITPCEQTQQEKDKAGEHQQLQQKEAEEEIVREPMVDKQYLLEMKVHRSVTNYRLIDGISFRNPNPWSSEKKIKTDDKPSVEPLRLAAPPPPPLPTLLQSKAFNTYECSWKRSTRQSTATLQLSSPHQNHTSNLLPSNKQLLLTKNQLPAFTVNTSCKEPRRTFIILESYCVATT